MALKPIDKPKVVSQSQSQMLTAWFSLKSQCSTKTKVGKMDLKRVICRDEGVEIINFSLMEHPSPCLFVAGNAKIQLSCPTTSS